MSMDEHKFKPNADTINAIVTALGGLTFALTEQLAPQQRKALSKKLVFLARSRNAVGDTTAGTLLLDMALSAEVAARPD
jgi:hypothetical protein